MLLTSEPISVLPSNISTILIMGWLLQNWLRYSSKFQITFNESITSKKCQKYNIECLVENNFCLTDCRNHANHKQKSASMLHFRIPQKTANAKHSYDRYICTARMSKCKTFSGLIITRKYDDNLNVKCGINVWNGEVMFHISINLFNVFLCILYFFVS